MKTPVQKPLKRWLGNRLITNFVLACSLTFVSAALADYKPPENQQPPRQRTTGTLTRDGCQGQQNTSLTALAPQMHVGRTISTHPTFSWFVPDSQPYLLEFRLYDYTPNGRREILLSKELQSQPGIMTLSLSPEEIELSVGQNYYWQVIVYCNPNRPSSALVVGAEIEVVPLSSMLRMSLAKTNDSIERANLYARSGLWYDALSEALQARQTIIHDGFKLSLLEDLAELEGQESEQSERLRRVIEAEQQPGYYSGVY